MHQILLGKPRGFAGGGYPPPSAPRREAIEDNAFRRRGSLSRPRVRASLNERINERQSIAWWRETHHYTQGAYSTGLHTPRLHGTLPTRNLWRMHVYSHARAPPQGVTRLPKQRHRLCTRVRGGKGWCHSQKNQFETSPRSTFESTSIVQKIQPEPDRLFRQLFSHSRFCSRLF